LLGAIALGFINSLREHVTFASDGIDSVI